MTVTNYTITFTLRSQESLHQIDMGRNGNPLEEQVTFIGKMIEVVRDNWADRFEGLVDLHNLPEISYEAWEAWMRAEHPEPRHHENYGELGELVWDDDAMEKLDSTFNMMQSFLSDADYHAFTDSDTDCFHIFDGPYLWDNDYDFNMICEVPGGWQIQPAAGSVKQRTTHWQRDAAIIQVFEQITCGNYEDEPVFVIDSHSNIWRVENYGNEARVLVNERGNKP